MLAVAAVAVAAVTVNRCSVNTTLGGAAEKKLPLSSATQQQHYRRVDEQTRARIYNQK